MFSKTCIIYLLYVVVICAVCFEAQSSPVGEESKDVAEDLKSSRLTDWDEPLAYLDDITQKFGERLKEYGFDNLPVPDKQLKINDTRYNIHLLGTAQYSNGFVVDVLNISRYYRQYVWYFNNTDAIIQYKILMGDVKILYDLNAQLEVASLVGTADLTFPENLMEVFITCNRDTMERTVTSMKTNAVLGPKTVFAPDSDVMRALAYNARLTMAKTLFSDLSVWIEKPLKDLLEAVVQEVPFPLK